MSNIVQQHCKHPITTSNSGYTVVVLWHLWVVMGANPAKGTHDIIGSALAAQVCAVIDNSTTQENTEIIGSWSQIFSEFSDFLRVLRKY